MRIKMHQNNFFVHHFFEQTPWQVLVGLLVINVRMQNELLYVKVGGALPPFIKVGGISPLCPHPQPPMHIDIMVYNHFRS